jgi:hypothetical protein
LSLAVAGFVSIVSDDGLKVAGITLNFEASSLAIYVKFSVPNDPGTTSNL